MILEDRRVRMNYWTSKITHKPIEKFKNPNLLNINEKVDRNDIKNPYFTLSRILPISLHMEKTKVISTDTTYDKLHFDYTIKTQLESILPPYEFSSYYHCVYRLIWLINAGRRTN